MEEGGILSAQAGILSITYKNIIIFTEKVLYFRKNEVAVMNENEFWGLCEQNQAALEKVISCNDYTQMFGIHISREDAELLLEERKHTLKEQGRVEFGEGILPKLFFTFCDSPYLYQDNYVDMIARLQEIFYLYKNESLDDISDEELLTYMKEQFDGECQGSLEYLEETSLEAFARNIRKGTVYFMGRRHKDDFI